MRTTRCASALRPLASMTIARSRCRPFCALPVAPDGAVQPAAAALDHRDAAVPVEEPDGADRAGGVRDRRRAAPSGGTHAFTSGSSQATVGPSTTRSAPEAKAVFGSRSSPTESTFFASWKSAADAAQLALTLRERRRVAGQREERDARDGVVRGGADQDVAVRDHERERIDAGVAVEHPQRDQRPTGGHLARDQPHVRRLDVVHPRAQST